MKYHVVAFMLAFTGGAYAQDCPYGKDWFSPNKCYTPPGMTSSTPAPAGVKLANFTLKSVYTQVQCEVGKLAIEGKKYSLPAGLKARFVYTSDDQLSLAASESAELGVKIAKIISGPSVNGSWTSTNTIHQAVQSDFNIAGANTQACRKGHQPPVNVYACLSPQIEFLQSGKGGCTYTSEAVGKLSANGKFIVWFINVGPSFEYDVKRTYTVNVSAPPQDDGGGQKEAKK